MKSLLALIGFVAVVLVAVAGAWVYLGKVDISADGEHLEQVDWFLEFTREQAVERAAADISARLPDLSGGDALHEAVIAYEDMCAGCHTPPGETRTALAQGLNPRAPNLSVSANHLPPEALFWVTKHGIRMTGMPAWGKTHGDDELWRIVALITRFPEFGDDEYSELLEAAREEGVTHVHGDDREQEDEHEHNGHHH